MDDEKKSSYAKRPLWQWIVLYVVVGVLVYGLVYYFVLAKKGNSYMASNSNYPSPTKSMQPTTAPAMEKFADSPDYKNAYKVFPGVLSADAKKALTGFDMQTKDLGDGSTQITLVAKKQEYTTQTLTVKKGESLYFIETFAMDDNQEEDTDNGLKDDTAVVVDANGYLVK